MYCTSLLQPIEFCIIIIVYLIGYKIKGATGGLYNKENTTLLNNLIGTLVLNGHKPVVMILEWFNKNVCGNERALFKSMVICHHDPLKLHI